MKSKAKPTKGSARTKRFDVGGTVGALAGLGTLAYLMSRKKKGADESSDVAARRASGAYRGGAGTDTTTDTTPTADDAGRQRALQQSKDPKSNLVPEGADKDVLYESDKALVRTDDKKAAPVIKPKIPPKKRVDNTTQGSSTNTGVDAGIEAGQRKKSDKPAAPTLKPGESRATGEGTLKPYPAAEAAKKKAEVRASKYTTPGDPNKKEATSKAGVVLGGSTVRSDKEKMGERAREVQRRREEEMKSRYKKGGAVKKYANGGSVMASKMGSVKTAKPSMRSASSRADGIAQRGKTRA
jgi:hypothetical protein